MLGTQKSVFFYVGLALGFNGTWDMTRGCKTRDALEYRVRSTTCKHVQTGARKESTVPVYFITHGLVKGGGGEGEGQMIVQVRRTRRVLLECWLPGSLGDGRSKLPELSRGPDSRPDSF